MATRLSNFRAVTALITPFGEDGIDRQALTGAIDRQLGAGMDAVLLCDVTGEGHALSDDERDTVLTTCLARAQGRLAVIAATGTNGTASSIALTRRAQQLGADGILLTVPYYSKPTAEGVAGHFRSIADTTHLPIIIDDDPQRTVVEAGPALLAALSDVENIVGIRHGVGRLAAFCGLGPVLRRRYHHYCGDGIDPVAFLACGGHGVMCSYGNLYPASLAGIGRGLVEAGDLYRCRMETFLSVTGSCPDVAIIKAACALLHGQGSAVRLPLVKPDPELVEALRVALADADLPSLPLQQQAAALSGGQSGGRSEGMRVRFCI